MKTRILFLLVAALMVVSFAFAQDKEDCTKACDVKTASATKSCCMEKSKVASKTADATAAKVIFASDKKTVAKTSAKSATNVHECPAMNGAKASGECSEAEMAKCTAAKAKMVKAGDKAADCCKDKAKVAKADKKAPEKAEAKGTN
jgi:hypothetical protein